MFYNINYIFFYSILGFLLESFYYKLHNSNLHSGVFTGPYNFIYGIGMFLCLISYKLLPIHQSFISIIIYYIIFVIITTTIEFLSGHIIYYFFKFDKWNYSNYKYHFGKYICLKNSLIWGILASLSIYFLNPYLDLYVLYTIPQNFTILMISLFVIDLIYLKKNRQSLF